jgi:hypothetical protein
MAGDRPPVFAIGAFARPSVIHFLLIKGIGAVPFPALSAEKNDRIKAVDR